MLFQVGNLTVRIVVILSELVVFVLILFKLLDRVGRKLAEFLVKSVAGSLDDVNVSLHVVGIPAAHLVEGDDRELADCFKLGFGNIPKGRETEDGSRRRGWVGRAGIPW